MIMETRLFIIVSALSVLLSSCGDEGAPPPAARHVVTAEVSKGTATSSSTFTGEIAARDQSDLAFRVSGRITAMHADVGSRVKKGQILAVLDDRQQQADVEIATAGLKAAEAQLERARSAWQRQNSLFQQGVTPRSSLDGAQETLKTSENDLSSARSELASKREALSYTKLLADEDGIVLSRDGEVGQIAQEAQPVLSVARGERREAIFNVPEGVLLTRERTDVGVSLLQAGSRKLEGRVTEVSPAIDLETGTLMVKVSLPDDANDFPLGAPVAGSFRTVENDAVVLPWTALTATRSKPAVWLVDPETSKVSLRQIELGVYQTGSFQVLSGLQSGDLVVTEGGKLLRLGQTVSRQQEAKP
jgi:membrane fusion protein, multidrug efflux system